MGHGLSIINLTSTAPFPQISEEKSRPLYPNFFPCMALG